MNVTDAFTEALYQTDAYWESTMWLGHRCVQSPLDLWSMQEIIVDTRPDLIVETGSRWGGTSLFLASVCDLIGHGNVVSIDIEANGNRPHHPRLRGIRADSTAGVPVDTEGLRVMVTLDAEHDAPFVLRELAVWAPVVTVGCYLVVQDTALNGHPIRPDFGPGPGEALAEWLPAHPEFEADRSREKFLSTYHPGGWLRRIS